MCAVLLPIHLWASGGGNPPLSATPPPPLSATPPPIANPAAYCTLASDYTLLCVPTQDSRQCVKNGPYGNAYYYSGDTLQECCMFYFDDAGKICSGATIPSDCETFGYTYRTTTDCYVG